MSHEQEPDEFQLPAELAEIERKLAGFTPAAVRVVRDQLMFAAGQAQAAAGRARASSRFWPAATAMMTAASILLAATLLLQHDVDRMAAKPQAASDVDTTDKAFGDAPDGNNNEFVRFDASHNAWPWSARPTSGYLGLRYVALTQGVGAIGDRPIAANGAPDEPSPPATARELLQELLPAARRASS